jgi:septal ring factor EnvC (AmiA/AmiB activator)
MNKQLAFKLVFVAAMLFAAFTIYNDEKEIGKLETDLNQLQKKQLELTDQNGSLHTQLDECCANKDSIPPVAQNGKYTQAQIDEMERKIQKLQGK